MVKIKIQQADASIVALSADAGKSLMWNAVQNNVSGIEGECGGEMSCATCHVYVSEEWVAKVPEASTGEHDLLEVLDSWRPESRLACQIIIDESLDGAEFTVAPQD